MRFRVTWLIVTPVSSRISSPSCRKSWLLHFSLSPQPVFSSNNFFTCRIRLSSVGIDAVKLVEVAPAAGICTNLYQHVLGMIRFFLAACSTFYKQFNKFMLRLLLLLC